MDKEIEDKVVSWFAEFEKDDDEHKRLLNERKIKPDFDFSKNKRLSHYILHCPVFYDLCNSNNLSAIKILHEIKNKERYLSKYGLESVNCVYHNCLSCKGKNGKKACEVKL
jgi:hypothetical protein